jgi:hypothetical protein
MVSKMLPSGEAGYGCKNRKPRYRHNPDFWLGGNHHCYGTVLNCHRDKHYGVPVKSALNHDSHFNCPVSHELINSHIVKGLQSKFDDPRCDQPRFRYSASRLMSSLASAAINMSVRNPVWNSVVLGMLIREHRKSPRT